MPWNLIRYAKISENTKKVCEKTNVKSGLLTGRMWDTTMKWMENSGINVTSNSAGWGNYRYASVENITEYSKNYGATWTYITSTTKESEDWLLKTGHTEYTNKKNIYDLAGNLMEIIAENYSNDYIVRGGYYKVRGSNDPAMYRGFVTGSGDATGFRVALFVQ